MQMKYLREHLVAVTLSKISSEMILNPLIKVILVVHSRREILHRLMRKLMHKHAHRHLQTCREILHKHTLKHAHRHLQTCREILHKLTHRHTHEHKIYKIEIHLVACLWGVQACLQALAEVCV